MGKGPEARENVGLAGSPFLELGEDPSAEGWFQQPPLPLRVGLREQWVQPLSPKRKICDMCCYPDCQLQAPQREHHIDWLGPLGTQSWLVAKMKEPALGSPGRLGFLTYT